MEFQPNGNLRMKAKCPWRKVKDCVNNESYCTLTMTMNEKPLFVAQK